MDNLSFGVGMKLLHASPESASVAHLRKAEIDLSCFCSPHELSEGKSCIAQGRKVGPQGKLLA